MSIEIRERTLPEKLMWYAAFIEDNQSKAELLAAAIQLPALLREAADALSDGSDKAASAADDTQGEKP